MEQKESRFLGLVPFQEKSSPFSSPSLGLTRPFIIRLPNVAEICVTMGIVLALLLVVCCHMTRLHHLQAEFTCSKGHYLHHHYGTPPACLPCPSNTFISRDNHTFTDCGMCKVADRHLNQIIVQPCTPNSDAVLGCPNGYFSEKTVHAARPGGCRKCADCSAEDLHEASPCNETHDAVCCAVPGMVAAITMTGQRICVFLQDREIAIINVELTRESQKGRPQTVDRSRAHRRTNSLSQILRRKAQLPLSMVIP